MEYSEFCQEIETCIEKMSNYLEKAYDAHRRIYYNRRIYCIGLDNDDAINAMESIRSSINRQVEHKINKIRYLGEYECWKNYFLFLITKNHNHIEKYEQEYPGKISYHCAVDFNPFIQI
jgi:hypothetical protein